MSIRVQTCSVKLGREASLSVVFTVCHYVKKSSWLYGLLVSLRHSNPAHHSDVTALRDTLALISSSKQWRKIVLRDSSSIDCVELLNFYHVVEEALSERYGVGSTTPRKYCGIFRRFIRNYLSTQPDCPQADTLSKFFSSRLPRVRSVRLSISDMPDPYAASPIPIGATPHSSISELKRKIIEKRQSTVERIEKACKAEIEKFTDDANWLKSFDDIEFTAQEYAHLKRMLGSKTNAEYLKLDPLRTIACAIQYVRRDGRPNTRKGRLKSIRNLGSSIKAVKNRLGKSINSFWSIYFFGDFGTLRILAVAIISIQLKTGWNLDSVLGLTAEHARKVGNRIRLQGLKDKTHDNTPPVWLDRSEVNAWWAINFILRRNHVMETHKFPSSGLLFAGLRKSVGIIACPTRQLREIQALHRLPAFSFEQIRVERLNLTSATRGVTSASVEAGHTHISTTDEYRAQPSERELNSAVNLEFMRRLETCIRASLTSGTASSFEQLTPLGDGSSCRDPQLPPVEEWLAGERCDATRCHAGEGCPNRRIVVSTNRMEEVVHTTLMYSASWRRLLDANSARFEEVHLPRLLFSQAFSAILANGPHAKAFREVKERVEIMGASQ